MKEKNLLILIKIIAIFSIIQSISLFSSSTSNIFDLISGKTSYFSFLFTSPIIITIISITLIIAISLLIGGIGLFRNKESARKILIFSYIMHGISSIAIFLFSSSYLINALSENTNREEFFVLGVFSISIIIFISLVSFIIDATIVFLLSKSSVKNLIRNSKKNSSEV